MATTDRTKIHLARATLLTGAAGVTPATAVGHRPRETGVSIEIGRADERFYSCLRNLPIAKRNSIETCVLRAGLWQIEPALLAMALGFSEDGQQVYLNSSTVMAEFSVKVVGDLKDGTDFAFTSLLAVPHDAVTLDFSELKIMEIPLVLDCLAPDSGNEFDFLFGAGNVTATLATGVLTRTASAGYHKVAGEGGAADVLASITGASLTNNETLRLQIADADDAITLTHLLDTLELTGGVDWVMDSIYDWIDLRYSTDDTAWHEYQRFDYGTV